MKTKYTLLLLLILCIGRAGFAQVKTDSIKVWGNCDMCKGRIEKAARDAGASGADWNDKTKMLALSYDAGKVSNLEIQKKIAAIGYDTQDVRASDSSYNNLMMCCQYKRPAATTAANTTATSCCQGHCSKMENCCKPDMSCCKDKTASADCCSNGKCKSGN